MLLNWEWLSTVNWSNLCNAPDPILVMRIRNEIIDVKAKHFSNALEGIDVTEAGMVIHCKFVHTKEHTMIQENVNLEPASNGY